MRTLLFTLAALMLLSSSCARKRTSRPNHVYTTKEERENIRHPEPISIEKIGIIESPAPYASQDLLPVMQKKRAQQILSRLAYTVSYNEDTKCANWVAWHLTKDHTNGQYNRRGMPYYDEDGTVVGIGAVNNDIYRNGYFLDLDVNPHCRRINIQS